jgi:hypothetical protein
VITIIGIWLGKNNIEDEIDTNNMEEEVTPTEEEKEVTDEENVPLTEEILDI